MDLNSLINLQNLITGLILAALIGLIRFIKVYFFIDGKLYFGSSPKIAGTYLSQYPDNPSWGETITVKQHGKRLSGTISENNENYTVKFKGLITPSRVIKYYFSPDDSSKNDWGVGLLKLDKYGKQASGYVIFLDDNNETPAVVKIILKKKS